ncbi:Hypothetical protein LRC_05970 [Ligilactobacillus ruminis ATCC 27782]|uniref:Uncharacterized protein n=1 Tax=Ligilactobacillus ruminis (strain ATCC 27782 / RF3) TaxID=1069534 RepID=G2SMC2_LIGR2|nr:Hypothetical protein LRC_05970 [Ligilactobacillus ruminis ATCC 27782]
MPQILSVKKIRSRFLNLYQIFHFKTSRFMLRYHMEDYTDKKDDN